MTLYEMEGFLRGKCVPGDMKVNETNAEYLVRKFSGLQSQNAELAVQLANAESKCRELAAENATLNDKMNRLATWPGIEFYSSSWEFCNRDGNDALEFMCDVQTPSTDAFLAEVRAQALTNYADKRGFSFQHGSIHAHFGNGDVMVGAVTFENGDAGINFAPVRDKTGGVGTSYEWTNGKTTEQVDSVFTIASSNAEGLEVIRDKLSEAIAQLRKGAAL